MDLDPVPGVAWSDHRSFWDHGWPALMVTDTAPFRNPHYHQETDRPEHLEQTQALAKAAASAREERQE